MRTPLEHTSRGPLSIALINPRFEPSFWGFDFALPLLAGNKRCWVVTGALPALAALTPPDCTVDLLDENVQAIDFAELRRFDVIGVTGMVVQAGRMREILERLKGLPAIVVVGGPYVSVAEDALADLCDVRFVGEAEETWPAFLNALAAGEATLERYQQQTKSDMTCVPPPRYDLVDARRYVMASLQFSRGCPFVCEFCDIITIFGRRPRLKTVEQMITELDAVHRAGFSACFIVDDNFIGNKLRAKSLLQALIDWQHGHGFPLQLSLEASINLADDAEMLDLMVRANVRQVFVGIESPRPTSLAETRKLQNLGRHSLEERIQRIRDAGLVVQAGFVVGFDNDDEAIFDEQFEFIQRVGISQALVSLLVPVPTTPLYERLQAEGRLDFSDSQVVFHPRLMSRAALKQGYARLVRRLYEPEAYFGRLFGGYRRSPAFRSRRARQDGSLWMRRPLAAKILARFGGLMQSLKLCLALARAGRLRRLGKAYLVAWIRENRPLGGDAIPFPAFVGLCVTHWHFFNVAGRSGRAGFGIVRPAPPERSTAGVAAAL